MRALWSDRPNCSHNVSQKVKRIRCFSEIDGYHRKHRYDGNHGDLLCIWLLPAAGRMGWGALVDILSNL